MSCSSCDNSDAKCCDCPVGPQGLPGVAGPPGAIGPIGATGPQGPIGPQGVQGVAGPGGPQGLTGTTGPTGQQGPVGLLGPQGPQGPAGPTGPMGLPGIQGPVGPTGPAGPAGTNGTSPLSGIATTVTGTGAVNVNVDGTTIEIVGNTLTAASDFVYLFGGYAAPGSTSPDGTSAYAPSLLTPVINMPFTGTVAAPMTGGATQTALSPVQTITNPSTTRHMMVQLEYLENIFLNGHSWPSTNDPVSFRWFFEQSVDGAPFSLASSNFGTMPAGWFISTPQMTRTSSLYLNPGQTITLQIRSTLTHNSGYIDNSAGGGIYQVAVQAFGQLV